MHRILVTGGAGYIGSHCCKALRQSGFEPVVFDNLSTGHRSFVCWGPLLEGDLRDGAAVEAALRESKPAAVMHLAALSLVGQSTDPKAYWDVNFGGTLQLLWAMQRAGVSRLIFSSTAAIYGNAEKIPIAETAASSPGTVYARTKAACEHVMLDFEAAYGIRSLRLRYFNAAGADPDGEIGEWHEPETHLIPVVLECALGRRATVEIFGCEYPTNDGTAIRDYLQVSDLADAHVAALRYLLDGSPSCALNLGTGKGSSVAEVIRTVEIVTGRSVPVKRVGMRNGDPAALVADPGEAESRLGWRANKDLRAMIEDAWKWHRKLGGDATRAE